MTDFLAELERLNEKATKGPLTIDESNWELVAVDTDPYKYLANFDALDFSASDLSDEEIKANAKLYVFLRNHADEIAELVKAAEKAREAMMVWTNTYAPEMCDSDSVKKSMELLNEYGTLYYIATVNEALSDALANLNKEKP